MSSIDRATLKQQKYEENLKKRLKKLFANDLYLDEKRKESPTTECNGSEYFQQSIDFPFSKYQKPKKERKSSEKKLEIKSYSNKQKNRDAKMEEIPISVDSSGTNKVLKQNYFEEKPENRNVKKKKTLRTKNKPVDNTKPEPIKYGPIATGYVPVSSLFLENKRKNKENSAISKKARKMDNSVGNIKNKAKSNLPHFFNENFKDQNFYNLVQEVKSSKQFPHKELGPTENMPKVQHKDEFDKNSNISKSNGVGVSINGNELLKNRREIKNQNNIKGNDIKVKNSKGKEKEKCEIMNELVERKCGTNSNDSSLFSRNKKRGETNSKKNNVGNSVKTAKNENLSLVKNCFFKENVSEIENTSDCEFTWQSSLADDSSYTFDEEEEESYSDSEDDDYSYSEDSSFIDEVSDYVLESDEFSNDLEYNFESESNDEDYELPENEEEDLYIPQGIATKYDIDENMNINFDSNNTEAQIIELPVEPINLNIALECSDFVTEERLSIFNKEGNLATNADEDSDNSCPELVPINFEPYNEIKNSNCEHHFIEGSISELSSGHICSDSDSNSEYSEATEGSLCLKSMEKKLEDVEASMMEPKIFSVEICKTDIESNLFSNDSSNSDEVEVSVVENILEKSACDDTNTNVLVTTLKGNDMGTTLNDSSMSTEYFNSKFYDGLDSRHVLILLKEKIHIYGTVKLQLIAGTVDIFGYRPSTNETLELYSPKGYGFLSISTCKNNSKSDLNKSLQNFKDIFLTSELNEIANNFNSKTDAILLLQKNYFAKKIELLGKYMKENLFPSMNPMQIDRSYYASEFILRTIIYNSTDHELIIDPKWQTIDVKPNTRLMIIGGKSVGKSTCLRYIVNKEIRKHKKILFIDLDVGQSEIFLPQTISATVLNGPLLGPGYFLSLNPNKAVVFGDVNIVLAPERYLQNIKDLSVYCHENEEFKDIPWLINTMGYNKGFGSELIAVLCHYLRPTEVLQLQSQKTVNNFDNLMEKEVLERIPLNVFKKEDLVLETPDGKLGYLENLKFEITIMDSIHQKIRNNSSKKPVIKLFSKDSRYAMLIIRLGTILGEKFDWFTDIKPIFCCVDDIKFKTYSNDILTEEEFLDTINANLVYMCNYKNEQKSLECFGIGIVRGVDKINRKIYLISSVSKENLNNVNCLSICNMPLPSSIFLNQGPKIIGNVPYIYNTNEFIASRPIKNFSRPKQGNKDF